jgi:ribosomal protein L5
MESKKKEGKIKEKKNKQENPMRKIRIEKVVVNVSGTAD